MEKIRKLMRLRGGGDKSTRLDGIIDQAVVTQPDGIRKSASDTRSYRAIKLPNKLEALLISDPKSEKAAASLTVNVGSYSDPPELPGLAHFLEHMLFMGTEKYPQENEYSSYLSENGGFSNAYTATEYTNYQFEVVSGKLEGALDRFAQFFIAPLLLEDATEREIKAVDNECSGNQQNDSWRSYLIYRELAHEYHPIHKFNIGNMLTLKTEPERKGINTREALMDFYRKFYSSNLMKLVVLGNESLDDLEGMVQELFSSVPNYEYQTPYVHPDPAGPAFDSINLQKMIKVVPVKDIRRIEMTWLLPKMTTENKLREASSYLGSLFGDEGEGSILSHLKKLGWANGLYAGKSNDNYDLSSFSVTVQCTDLGITDHVEDIIEVVANYVNMLIANFQEKEPSAYYFEEQKVMGAIYYWFKSDQRPLSCVMNLAAKMQSDIEINDILVNGYLNMSDSFEEVKYLLSFFKPENMLCFVSSQSFEDIADREETYFNTKYSVSDIPKRLIDVMVGAAEFEKLDLYITPSNKFIPSSFIVLPYQQPVICKCSSHSSPLMEIAAQKTTVCTHKTLQHAGVKDKVAVVKEQVERSLLVPWEDDTFRWPTLIHSDNSSSVWLKQDTTHNKPKAIVSVFLRSSAVGNSLFEDYATSIFIRTMEDTLNEETYAASSAGFSHSILSNANGIFMKFNGFSETLFRYVELVASKLRSFAQEKLDETLFGRFKEEYLKNIMNANKLRPVGLANIKIAQATKERSESLERQYDVAYNLSKASIEEFAPKIFEDVSLEILATGNTSAKDALRILAILKKIFQPTRSIRHHTFLRTVNLSGVGAQQYFFIEAARDPENPGSGFCAAFQFGEKSHKSVALLNVLGSVLHEQFFNDLRTKQTLGYIVQAGTSVQNGILTIKFYVESNSTDPLVLNYKLERFIDDFRKSFTTLFAPERFMDIVNAEIGAALSRSPTLASETQKWWRQLYNGLYSFDESIEVSKQLANLTPDDLSQLLDEFFWPESPRRAKFVAGVLGEKHGLKIFGQDYAEMKPKKVDGVQPGFSEDFIVAWLDKDIESTQALVESRGKLNIISDLEKFKATAQYYPSVVELGAKL